MRLYSLFFPLINIHMEKGMRQYIMLTNSFQNLAFASRLCIWNTVLQHLEKREKENERTYLNERKYRKEEREKASQYAKSLTHPT